MSNDSVEFHLQLTKLDLQAEAIKNALISLPAIVFFIPLVLYMLYELGPEALAFIVFPLVALFVLFSADNYTKTYPSALLSIIIVPLAVFLVFHYPEPCFVIGLVILAIIILWKIIGYGLVSIVLMLYLPPLVAVFEMSDFVTLNDVIVGGEIGVFVFFIIYFAVFEEIKLGMHYRALGSTEKSGELMKNCSAQNRKYLEIVDLLPKKTRLGISLVYTGLAWITYVGMVASPSTLAKAWLFSTIPAATLFLYGYIFELKRIHSNIVEIREALKDDAFIPLHVIPTESFESRLSNEIKSVAKCHELKISRVKVCYIKLQPTNTPKGKLPSMIIMKALKKSDKKKRKEYVEGMQKYILKNLGLTVDSKKIKIKDLDIIGTVTDKITIIKYANP